MGDDMGAECTFLVDILTVFNRYRYGRLVVMLGGISHRTQAEADSRRVSLYKCFSFFLGCSCTGARGHLTPSGMERLVVDTIVHTFQPRCMFGVIYRGSPGNMGRLFDGPFASSSR